VRRRVVQMLPRARGLDLARELCSLFLQQRVQCRLAVTAAERGKQSPLSTSRLRA
jgi:hypothetical protein